ncbi:MAG: LacI family DNA-binding transcriptional regulator [Clostridia bacterium]|nr:LacI family DNA-binding transcriptional regulator [Clostridia bacterium]
MSLKKIAEITGVSISTVSRVLNDAPGPCASKAIREKIWRAAQDIGYAPNRSAQALRRGERAGSARRIAIVTSRIHILEEDPFFHELYMSVRSELYGEGCAFFRLDIRDENPSDIPPATAWSYWAAAATFFWKSLKPSPRMWWAYGATPRILTPTRSCATAKRRALWRWNISSPGAAKRSPISATVPTKAAMLATARPSSARAYP